MKRTFFISDAHLGYSHRENERTREASLVTFLEHVADKGNALFILGDLFDFWFEYRSVIPRHHFSILYRLRDLVLRKIRIVYVVGNHDFGISNFFNEELGIEVVTKPLDTELGGKRLYVAHGDGLLEHDRGSRLLHRIIRHPVNNCLFRLIHPDLGFQLAHFISKASRKRGQTSILEAEYREFARKRFAEGFDAVVLAHTHQSEEMHENGHTYVNTGDWMTQYTYGMFHAGRMSLQTWPHPEEQHSNHPSRSASDKSINTEHDEGSPS